MRAGDGVAVEECEELAKSVEEGPVGEKTDALVGVNQAGGGAVGAGGGDAAGCSRRAAVGGRGGGAGGRGGGCVWIQAEEVELGELLVRQALLRVRLVELNGSTVHLEQGDVLLSIDTKQAAVR